VVAVLRIVSAVSARRQVSAADSGRMAVR
jgi:hypothetical protein